MLKSMADWGSAMRLMSRTQCTAIHELAWVTGGVDPANPLCRKLSEYLGDHMATSPDGQRLYLKSPHHRQLIQASPCLLVPAHVVSHGFH